MRAPRPVERQILVTRRADGALEQAVLQVLWSADEPLQPGEINDRLGAGHAYTSVATVLSRLLAKGLVGRQPAGRAYAYFAELSEAELAARRIAEVLESTSDRPQVLNNFISGLSRREATLVRRLLDQSVDRRGSR